MSAWTVSMYIYFGCYDYLTNLHLVWDAEADV